MAKYEARPTIHNGVRMRSRLEGTVAARLDRSGMAWRYEPCAFSSSEGQYLPDFVVESDVETIFIEAKPTEQQARIALANAKIIRASDANADLICVWPDEQMKDFFSWETLPFRLAIATTPRGGREAWRRWLLVNPPRELEETEYGFRLLSSVGDRVSLVISEVPITELFTEARALVDTHVPMTDPLIQRAADVRSSTGDWTLVAWDRSLAPSMIEVSEAGVITDTYLGQDWACSDLYMRLLRSLG